VDQPCNPQTGQPKVLIEKVTGESFMTHDLKTGGDRGYLRIATEEAFATREQIDVYLRMVKDGTADKGMVSLWGFYGTSPSERATQILDRLLDLGDQRIAHMDETGIDVAILALTSPGVQPFLDSEEAKGIASRANDYLAERCAAHPTRFVGMTAIAPQDPEWRVSRASRSTATPKAIISMSHSSIQSSARSRRRDNRSMSTPPRCQTI
jgi:predicted TIM-barrel fold metal-dependent hydrolase